MKTAIDIEKLVQWAMRDELPKGQAVAASPWDMITQYAALGVRVQTSGFNGDGFGFTPGAPHADALIVADAIGAIGTVATFDHADEVLPLFGDLAPIAGNAVDGVMSASFDPRSIVISNATMGTRPKWKFDEPTAYQMFSEFRDDAGAIRRRPLVHGVDAAGDVVAILPNRGRAVARDGMYSYAMAPRSPLDWQCPSMLHVGDCRAEYVAWHGALVQLVADLDGKLAEFQPTPPAAAALPWITGPTPVSRVVPGRDLGVVDGLPIQPRREISSRPLGNPRASRVRFVDAGNFVPQPTSKVVLPVG